MFTVNWQFIFAMLVSWESSAALPELLMHKRYSFLAVCCQKTNTRFWFLYQEKIKMIINHNATTQDKGIKRWSERLNELMEEINIYQSSNNV